MTVSAKTFVRVLRAPAIFDLTVFTILASVAIGAGYNSIRTPTAENASDITGSTRPVKAAPITVPQPMPDPIDAPKN
jgi:hypothetical protein